MANLIVTRTSVFKILAICNVVMALACSQATHAGTLKAGQHDDLFVPDKLNYYNPLKHNSGKVRRYETRTSAMDNQALLDAADQILANEMSAEQRTLNYQWLEQNHYNDDPHLGSKVFSKLMKMGFRTYWDGVRNKHYSSAKAVPDSNGNGKVTEEVDYKIRLSGNKIKLTFQYDF